jgi:hypothetical protein
LKNFLLQNVVRADIFNGSLAVFMKERGKPLNFLGFFVVAPSEARGEGERNRLIWTQAESNCRSYIANVEFYH